MRRKHCFGRRFAAALVAAVALLLIVLQPARASCSLEDLYNSVANGAVNGATYFKDHPGCAAYMENPVYWIVTGAIGVAMLHAKDEVGNVCNEVQASNKQIADKVKKASDDASKIDGWMGTLGFGDDARDKVKAVFGDVASSGGDLAGFTDFLACACATVQTAGFAEIVRFGNDCVVEALCDLSKVLGFNSCESTNLPVQQLDCTIPDLEHAFFSVPGTVIPHNGYYYTNLLSTDTSKYSGAACYCPDPMVMVSHWNSDNDCNGYNCDVCECPKGMHAAGKDQINSRICLCHNNQLPDANGQCPPPPPPEKVCHCPNNQVAAKVKNADGSTACSCGCGTDQDLIAGSCVSACAVPSQVKLSGGACCAPSQVSSCGTCCGAGLKPDPASGSCISALMPAAPKSPLSKRPPRF